MSAPAFRRPRALASLVFVGTLAWQAAARADTPPVLRSMPEISAPAGVSLPAGASVRLLLTLDETGAVVDVQVLDGLGASIDALVVEAARRMRFEPATREGRPVRARVRFRYRLGPAPTGDRPSPALGRGPALSPGTAPEAPERPDRRSGSGPRRGRTLAATDRWLEPGVTVRGRFEPGAATRESFHAEELTTVPGTFGEPLRVVASMPGVGRTPLGAGFFLVRGASFENTGFIVDGFPILNLYHFGAGPSVLAPNFVSQLDFYPGNYPLAYGRFSAGIVHVRTDQRPPSRPRADFSVDLFRASAYGAVGFDGGRGVIALAGRRSYYDPFLRALAPGIDLNFGDAQLRLEYSFSERLRLTVFTFASTDTFTVGSLGPFIADERRSGLRYSFWRGISRVEIHLPRSVRAEWSGMVGHDHVEVLSPGDRRTEVATLSGNVVGQRLAVRLVTAPGMTTSAGIDMLAQAYQVTATEGSDTVDPTQLTQLSLAGYLEEVLRVGRFEVTTGLRLDHVRYQTIDRTLADPRAVARVRLHDRVTAVLGSGVFHQLPNALLMVAGFQLPPQRAWQNSLGIEVGFGGHFDARVTGFFNYLFDLPDRGSLVPGLTPRAGSITLPTGSGFSGQGRAYGLEWMLRRRLERGLYGWVTYTLSRSERFTPEGPVALFNYDQTHVFNLALSWRVSEHWRLGARFQYATGTPTANVTGAIYDADRRAFGAYIVDPTDRNPPSHQLDLRVDYLFTAGPLRMNAFLDVINVYNNQNGDLGWLYRFDYAERRPMGSLPILPTIGLRGEL